MSYTSEEMIYVSEKDLSASQSQSKRSEINAASDMTNEKRQMLNVNGSPRFQLHPLIIRSPAAFRRHPVNNLIRIHDVARLAAHAVRKIDLQAAPVSV